MPILIEAPPAEPTPVVPSRPPTWYPRLLLVNSTGESWTLTDGEQGLDVTAVTGFGAPPQELVTRGLASGGAMLTGVRVLTREVSLTLKVIGGSREEMRDRLRQFATHLAPEAADAFDVPTPLRLVLAHPDGQARELEVHYVDGFEDADPYTTAGDVHEVVVRLLAPSPWTRDAVAQTVTLRQEASGSVLPATLPLTLGSSRLFGESITVDNGGDAPTYGVWTLTGPMSEFRALHEPTGREWRLERSLAAGEVATVDTGRPRMSAVLDDGTDLWGDIPVAYEDLWPLVRGANVMTWDAVGASSGTEVALTYHRQYRTF